LRTDNGSPFAHRLGLGGLSVLSVWFLKLDIWPDRIAPGRPDQNGRHERMHRRLGEQVADPPAATQSEQQVRFDLWREDFNTNRPHEALSDETHDIRRSGLARTAQPRPVEAYTGLG